MVFQTVYILSASQPKYINLRHIAIKWLIIYGFIEIKRGYSQKLDINSQLMICFIDILILLIAFPSRTLKTIHLKYFSHKQQKKFQNSVKDPKTYDITFGQRLLTAFIIYSLQILKHLIAFVPPNFRKSVQQPVRNINKVMIQRKCFWSIYQQSKQSEEQVERAKNKMIQYLVPSSKTPTTTSFNPSKDLQIRALAQQCSTHTMKPIKKISIKYNPLNSQLEITDLDFNKAIVYILQQVNQQDNVTIQFKAFQSQSTQQETIIARFKSSKQLQNFVRSIEQAQSMI